jgi:tetratricopeptide (TPR) repeat protein/energy-coupling factor transporter ATP-binding protein EcfA2
MNSSEPLTLSPDQARHSERVQKLAETAAKTGQGSVVFVVGGSGSGKTHLIQHMADDLRREVTATRVVTGSVADGRYVSVDSAEKEARLVSTLASFFSNIGDLPIPLLSPALKVLSQVLELSSSARGVLEPLLTAAAREGPLICLVDDADCLGGDWWLNLQFSLAATISRELPVVLVLAVNCPEEVTAPDGSGLAAHHVAQSLASRSCAYICQLEPLDVEGIVSWIHASPSLATKVVEATGGYAGGCVDLWRDLRDQGLIEHGHLGWELTTRQEIGLDYAAMRLSERIAAALGHLDPTEVEKVRRALFCAALEGRTFTAEAVAAVCERGRDEMIDLLDGLSDSGDHGAILRELGSFEVESVSRRNSRHVWRYGFARTIDWRVARDRLGDGFDRAAVAGRLADELIEIYGDEVRWIAHAVAALLRQADRSDAARDYERLAWLNVSAAVLRSYCQYIASLETANWTNYDFRSAAEFILRGCRELELQRPWSESISYAKRAEELAAIAGPQGARATAVALLLRGRFERVSGHNSEARRCLLEVVDRSRSGMESVFAEAQRELGSLAMGGTVPDLVAAREHFESAIEIFKSTGSRIGQATCLAQLAELDLHEQDFPAALTHNDEALKIESGEVGRTASVVAGLQQRAKIAMGLEEFEVVRDLALEILPVSRTHGHLRDEAAGLYLLAKAEMHLGNTDASRSQLLAALAINRQLDWDAGEASCLLVLGDVEVQARQTAKAEEYFEMAAVCYRRIGDLSGVDNSQRRLERLERSS